MAFGIVEKGYGGLFDNEIEFNGKYAIMARYLKEEIGLFTTLREVYVVSSIVGFINNTQKIEEVKEKVQSASIFPNELSKRKPDLRFIYRLIMLLKEEDGFTLDDYKNRTFRDDPEENMETIKSNMRLFNSFACGGVEFLYEKFKNCTKLDDVVNVLYEFLHQFSIGIGLLEGETELPDFEPEFD